MIVTENCSAVNKYLYKYLYADYEDLYLNSANLCIQTLFGFGSLGNNQMKTFRQIILELYWQYKDAGLIMPDGKVVRENDLAHIDIDPKKLPKDAGNDSGTHVLMAVKLGYKSINDFLNKGGIRWMILSDGGTGFDVNLRVQPKKTLQNIENFIQSHQIEMVKKLVMLDDSGNTNIFTGRFWNTLALFRPELLAAIKKL